MHEEGGQYERSALNGAYGTGTPPRKGSGDRHHAITDPDEMISMGVAAGGDGGDVSPARFRIPGGMSPQKSQFLKKNF